jgi:hypothetical protein
MSPEDSAGAGPFVGRWVVANSLGWLIGFVLVIALALLLDLVGGNAQFMVGVGMGAGVGYMQSRVVEPWIDSARLWVTATTVGMGVPFALWDVSTPLGLGSLFSLPLCVGIGGLLVGVLQWRRLRHRSTRAAWWIPISLVGWALPVGFITLNDLDLVPAPWGELLSIAAMFLGGALLGAVTGKPLRWIVDRAAV